MKWLYAAFWTFIGVMLLWQFYSYNHHVDEVVAKTPPRPQHFYIVNGKMVNDLTPPPAEAKANVQQIATSYENGVPDLSQFTYHVILKNKGTLKATNIQILISPFRGIILNADNDNGGGIQALPDSDPLAQINQWVSCPDLGPGEQKTVDAMFPSQSPATPPGKNPNPPIKFTAVNPDAAPAPSTH